MATLTVRNIPDDAKHRFRQVAAAHGRSMEEHLRQLVIDAEFDEVRDAPSRVAEAPRAFHHQRTKEDIVAQLIQAADGADFSPFLDPRKYAEIRYLSAKDAMAELRRLANGVGLDLPPRQNTALEDPGF